MSTTSRGTGNGPDLRALSIILLELLIVIDCAKAIDYAAYRADAIPRGVTRESARTTRDILEELNLRRPSSSHDLQDGTEHVLQYGALLRTQILDTFGKLVYDHYDDFGMGQIEALYRIYRDTLERKYNIFDIVPMILNDPDTRPTKICAHINERIRTCLKESSESCMNIRIHDDPHPDTTSAPALNVTRQIYRLSEIAKHYPNGFSLDAVLDHLRDGRIRFTPALFSGLLHNVQYDSFDDRVRTAERELILFLNRSKRYFASKMTEDASANAGSVSQLLKSYLADSERIFSGKAAEHAAYLAQHVVREVDAVSENIELLGTVYDNATINLGYLFELILPDDVVDRDVREARDYLLGEVVKGNILESHLRVEKYQQAGPDQLLMEILGQLRDIEFAVDIVTSLHSHARFWHNSHMIGNLNELLELFDAYENLRGLPDFTGLLEVADTIRNNLRDSRNVTVELLCSGPRACLRIGLGIVSNCSIVNEETKRAIEEFVERTTCGCSCLVQDSQVIKESMTTKKPNRGDAVITSISQPGTAETDNSMMDNSDESTVISTFTESVSKTIEISTSSSNSTNYDDDADSWSSDSSDYEEPSSEENWKDSTETTEIPGTHSPIETEEEESTEQPCEGDCGECNGAGCIPEVAECSGINCSTVGCTGGDCSARGNCTGVGCNEGETCEGPLCRDREIVAANCNGADCELNETVLCTGPDCLVNLTETPDSDQESSGSNSCDGDDCEISSCEGDDCENTSCKGDNCGSSSCDGDGCKSNSTVGINCVGPNCADENNQCEGPNCVAAGCVGDDCIANELLIGCKGANCTEDPIIENCEGDDCGGGSCEGDDCKSVSCEGDACEISSCEGDECNNNSCKGDGCKSETIVGNVCVGPNCADENNPCLGPNCSAAGCVGDDCKANVPLTGCKGTDCTEGPIIGNCKGDDCKSCSCKGDDCEGDVSDVSSCEGDECDSSSSCEGDECDISSCEGDECDISSCEGDECDTSSCEGDECDISSCEGEGCKSDSTVEKVCVGPNCADMNNPCQGPNCSDVGCVGDGCNANVPLTDCKGTDCTEGPIIENCEGDDCGSASCKGDNCESSSCEGDDCESDSCEGDACEISSCEGGECDSSSCEGDGCKSASTVEKGCVGPNCTDENNPCEGPNCPAAGCVGDDCKVNKTLIGCKGSGCMEGQIIENCEGPDCLEKVETCDGPDCLDDGAIKCRGDDCPAESAKIDCASGECSVPVSSSTIKCEGSKCPGNSAVCTGDNCPIAPETCPGNDCSANSTKLGTYEGDGTQTNKNDDSCEGDDCFEDSSEGDDCQDSDCSDSTSITLNCNGPECDVNSKESTCEGSSCSSNSGESCEGPDCSGSESDDSTDCEGAECLESEKLEYCKGSDCSPLKDHIDVSCDGAACSTSAPDTSGDCEGDDCSGSESDEGSCNGPDCPEPESTNGLCKGPDCSETPDISCPGENCPTNIPPLTSERNRTKNSTNNDDGNPTVTLCEGANCSEVVVKENCEDLDCSIDGEVLKPDCEGADCSEVVIKDNCDDGDCSIDGEVLKPDCEGADCSEVVVKDNCDNGDCSIDGEVLKPDCAGADCSEVVVKDNCDDGDCSIDGEVLKPDCEGADCSEVIIKDNCDDGDCSIDGEVLKPDCEGAGCHESNVKVDCKGAHCPAIDGVVYTSCEGPDCPVSALDDSQDCEGADCPNKGPCKGPNCSEILEISCPGENCPTNIPPLVNERLPTENSTNTSHPNQTVIFCDNADPHYRRKLKRLQKMRRIDADSSTPRTWSAMFAPAQPIIDKSKTSETIKSDKVNPLKNPLLQMLGIKRRNYPRQDNSTIPRQSSRRRSKNDTTSSRHRQDDISKALRFANRRSSQRMNDVLNELAVVKLARKSSDEASTKGANEIREASKVVRQSGRRRFGMKKTKSREDKVETGDGSSLKQTLSRRTQVEPVWSKVRGNSQRRRTMKFEGTMKKRDGDWSDQPVDWRAKAFQSNRRASVRSRVAGTDNRKVSRRAMKLRMVHEEVPAEEEASAVRLTKSRRSDPIEIRSEHVIHLPKARRPKMDHRRVSWSKTNMPISVRLQARAL